MMAFVVKKKIKGKEYYYLNENKRIDGKVKTKTLTYLGRDRKEADKKANEFLSNKELNQKDKMKEEINRVDISIEELASFCKRKGFVYPSGEIYGGLSGFWDFAHLGVELKNNIKKEWWNFHVSQREDIVGIDGAIITNPKTWEASGHIENFIDYVVKNKKTKEEFKIDAHEVEKYCKNENFEVEGKFNPMFTTNIGPHAEKNPNAKAYLRPETAQLIFSNFKNVYENARLKFPCGIAQIGKSFRNEIAPRDFLFRCREFEQMEIEYFIKPDQECPYEVPDENVFVFSREDQEKNKSPNKMKVSVALKKGIIKKKWHAYWIATEIKWFRMLGANMERFRIRQHRKDELSHYSTDTWDLEYEFPFGWRELEGIADRGDYDLSQHQKVSGKNFEVFDEFSKKRFLPHVICEPSLGVERAFLVFLLDSYFHDKERENIVLKLNPKLSPIKAAVFPIVKKEEFENLSQEVFDSLKKEFSVIHDISGSIGRRYSRNDEIGTPYCITIDGDSIKNKDVTVRDRDSKKQIRVKISLLNDVLRKLINEEIKFLAAGKEVK